MWRWLRREFYIELSKRKIAYRLAELINVASDGVMEFLLRDLISNITRVQEIAHHLEGGNYAHSYRSAIVTEYEQMVVGMVLYYASLFHRITEEMQEFFPKDRLEHLRSFYSARVENSLFLDALCVEKEFPGKGIGSELMSLTKKRAKENRCDVIYKVKE